jgi:predicted lipase
MQPIENRGRTIDGVVNPRNYAPFASIPDRATFDSVWASSPDVILAHMSHAAYCNKDYLHEFFQRFGASIKFYESHLEQGTIRGREAFLASWEDKAILAFRGTEADDKSKLKLDDKLLSVASHLGIDLPSELDISFLPTDIMDDLEFAPISISVGGGSSTVHRGFLKATDELWGDIQPDLDGLALNSNQLFVTGHSLGAAMAVIAALKYPFAQVVTFGEPGVGRDLDNGIHPGCDHIRYVNGSDPVTKIVPELLYPHHGEHRHLIDQEGADPRYDHSIINYAINLEAASQ